MWLSPERVRALPSSRVLEGLSEHAVEGLVQREEGRAEDAGVPAEVARHDLEPARGRPRRAAARFGVPTVIGFTGSSIWITVAGFPRSRPR